MKQLLSTILFLFTVTAIFAQPAADKISVIIKAGKFTINKAVISEGWRKDVASVTLGMAERKRPGYNTTYTYDNLGIVLFEKNDDKLPSGILSEVQFYISAGDTNAVSPKGFFAGKMEVEKVKISSNLDWKTLREKLKDYTSSESYMEHNFRLAYKGIYIYFKYNNEETVLQKMSIGVDKSSK
ncbi:hypothetical protein [Ferruginibacter sp. SUN106]|uniref:DUF7738 domain-containing protein n=1 Tax=Ferruginibacter sp. SUN106 TaxID=2978348 RepID=UPI003D36154A